MLNIVYIHLASNEWGNEFMLHVAEEAFKKYADLQPNLVVHVYEHAGWFLEYALVDGDIVTVGTANDAATFHNSKARAFRERVRSYRPQTVATIRRGEE